MFGVQVTRRIMGARQAVILILISHYFRIPIREFKRCDISQNLNLKYLFEKNKKSAGLYIN